MLAANVLDDAQDDLEKKEHLFTSFTPLSYFLFLLGALLTVVTRLAGIEGIEVKGE